MEDDYNQMGPMDPAGTGGTVGLLWNEVVLRIRCLSSGKTAVLYGLYFLRI